MKKEILVFSLATLSLLTFTGCNNSNAQALTTLQNQIKRVENIVAVSSTDDTSSVSAYSNISTTSTIQNHRANAYYNMTKENEIKQEVLYLNATVKNCICENVKLTKNKASAIKKISANISSNLSKYNETKGQIKNSVKSINQSLKVPKINVVGAESEYITLNSNMNERYVYLCNIYDNLEHAYFLICENCDNCYENSNNQITEPVKEVEQNKNESNRFPRFKKNIDSFSYVNKKDDKERSENESTKKNKQIKNIDTFNNTARQYNTYNYPPISGGYAYSNGFNGYGYNGYGYVGRFRRFNPNGNTDTFYPYNRNIDTYRAYPNFNYPANAIPANSEDKEEKINENGVINIEQNIEKEINDINSDIMIKPDNKVQENFEKIVDNNEDIYKNIKQG